MALCGDALPEMDTSTAYFQQGGVQSTLFPGLLVASLTQPVPAALGVLKQHLILLLHHTGPMLLNFNVEIRTGVPNMAGPLALLEI